jgi:hypothetical protein
MMALTGVVLGSSPSPTTWAESISSASLSPKADRDKRTDPEREIFGGKDSTKMLLLIDDEHTVGPLCRAELTSIGDADRVRDRQSGQRSKGRDGALLGSSGRLARTATLRTLRGGALARELRFNLLADCLRRGRSVSVLADGAPGRDVRRAAKGIRHRHSNTCQNTIKVVNSNERFCWNGRDRHLGGGG